MNKFVKTAIVVSYAIVIFAVSFIIIQGYSKSDKRDIGVRCVKLMYEFETPVQLANNQVALQRILSAECFEQMSIDNEKRVEDAYYKFGYSKSIVKIKEHRSGYVLYKIVNSDVKDSTYWVFLYQTDRDGKITSIKEYKLIANGEVEGVTA